MSVVRKTGTSGRGGSGGVGGVGGSGGTAIVAPRPRGGPVQAVRDSLVIAQRNIIRMARIPEVVIFGLIQPIMFVVLFSYVFGGSIAVGGSTDPSVYREFLMAGIFAQTVTFATAGAGAGIAEDMHKGLIDRFRSLPMARGAVLTGRTLADLVQTALTLVVLAVVAVIVGWRVHEGLLKALAGFCLLLLLGHAFSWIGALIGLSVRTPEAATSGGLIWLFPLTFVSNAFVPADRMPTVLRHIAEWNPFSATVQACRELFGNLPPGYPVPDAWPMQHPIQASLLWSLLIIGCFRTLAVRKYRSAAA
ncbi:ABC transporter permease [Streptomyces sp. SAJ15]|uniref:ABC transporter permease n=1 Tax=Streptomyces sp. SAJ15 TaxID=2011095 RepID=UPI0011854CF2|nr:ABC transporter permease [Streptomyces sp. SAJ15]TVL93879.1 ABC transporter [Streptomyces sp. SAJ15]